MAGEGGQHETWLKLREAASRLGVSERTIRRRIRDGSAQGRQVSTPFGTAWEVLVNGAAAADHLPTTPGGRANGHADPALMEALRMLEQRDQAIMELSGRVGFLQAELLQAREQLALMAPKADPVEGVTSGHTSSAQASTVVDSPRVEQSQGWVARLCSALGLS